MGGYPIEKALSLSFKDKDLLRLSLIHRSFLNENPGAFSESNERLEFLGDALVGLVVAQELFRRHPEKPEGELTTLRSALVRGDTLARIADSLELGEHLLMGRGEEASGGRERQSNLACAFEALLGAVFVDQGYEAARDFVLRVMADEIPSVESVPKSTKSVLQERVQRRGVGSPSYRVVEMSGEDHAREFTSEVTVSGEVVGRGRGRRKSEAEAEAASQALKALGYDV